jgi:hypothetical protein
MKTLVIGLLVGSVLGAWTSPMSGADAQDALRDALYRRFQPSRIEVANPARRGTVTRYGQLLVLAVEGVPAKPFRVMQANPTAPVSHVMDFARIEIKTDASIQAESGPLTLTKGTSLVVLDVALKGDRVHLLTHTASPVVGPPGGKPVYGCTEFVFDLEPSVVSAGRADLVIERIERWLAWTSGQRVCTPGLDPLCLEP